MTKVEKQVLAARVADEYKDFVVRREQIKADMERELMQRIKAERAPLNGAIRDLLDAGGTRYMVSKAVGNTNWHFITALVDEALNSEEVAA
jgi:hypothetical protein